MDVIRHETSTKYRQFEALLRAPHEADECRVVRRFVEDFGTTIRPVDDVITLVGKYQAWWTRHAANDMPGRCVYGVANLS